MQDIQENITLLKGLSNQYAFKIKPTREEHRLISERLQQASAIRNGFN